MLLPQVLESETFITPAWCTFKQLTATAPKMVTTCRKADALRGCQEPDLKWPLGKGPWRCAKHHVPKPTPSTGGPGVGFFEDAQALGRLLPPELAPPDIRLIAEGERGGKGNVPLPVP